MKIQYIALQWFYHRYGGYFCVDFQVYLNFLKAPIFWKWKTMIFWLLLCQFLGVYNWPWPHNGEGLLLMTDQFWNQYFLNNWGCSELDEVHKTNLYIFLSFISICVTSCTIGILCAFWRVWEDGKRISKQMPPLQNMQKSRGCKKWLNILLQKL